MSDVYRPSANQSAAVQAALSSPRAARYQNDVPDGHDPLDLYSWNAGISGAFWLPLHVCEVVIRNAVADILATVHGPNWHQAEGFMGSLKKGKPGRYSEKGDLEQFKRRSVEVAVVGVKFVFWEKLFVAARDSSLWDKHLHTAFPNLNPGTSVAGHREWIFSTLERVRKLRNRIAHHEPIYPRALDDDYQCILQLIRARCGTTAEWVDQQQQVMALFAQRPAVKAQAIKVRSRHAPAAPPPKLGVPTIQIAPAEPAANDGSVAPTASEAAQAGA